MFYCLQVILILGMAGGLRREEIYNICIGDVTKNKDNSLLVSIPKTKNGDKKSFVVMGELCRFIEKYQALRPAYLKSCKFLINYQKGKCTSQVVGINKIGNMPKSIAAFLGKADPKLYSGHSFRRTSATLLVDAGADITELKRHGGWKSTAVAEGYLGDSINNKKRIFSKITESIGIEEPHKKNRSLNLPISSLANSSIPSTSSCHDKENAISTGKGGGTNVYNLSNCTVTFVNHPR